MAAPFNSNLSAVVNASQLSYSWASGYWSNGALHATFNVANYPEVFYPFDPIDWSAVQAVAMDVENADTVDHVVYLRLDDVHGGNGVTHATYASATLPPGVRGTYLFPLTIGPSQYGMHTLPPVSGNWLRRDSNTIDLTHVSQWTISIDSPATPTRLLIYSVKPVPVASFAGCIDGFGQYAFASWNGKASSSADLTNAYAAETLDLASNPKPAQFDAYGGYLYGPQLAATGRFRTQYYAGRWWLVDPIGRLFFSMGLNQISRGDPTIIAGRQSLFSSLPASSSLYTQVSTSSGSELAYTFYEQNLQTKYGANYASAFVNRTVQRIWSWGFNTVGNWSISPSALIGSVPYVGTALLEGGYATVPTADAQWGPLPDPYDPLFQPAVANAFLAESYAFNDPMCLGWFVDNEEGWTGGSEENGRYGVAYAVLSLNVSASPAKNEFLQQLETKYGTIAALNKAWATQFASWAAMGPPITNLATTGTAARKTDFQNFIYQFALLYYQTIRSTLISADPEALYLGSRVSNINCPDVLKAYSQVADVMSFNLYATTLDSTTWSFLNAYNRPAMISEFSYGALDSGMFWTGAEFADSQAQRASDFTTFVHSVLDNPLFVGCHWFEYTDQPTSARPDGENANYGFVSITDLPYADLVSAARQTLGAAMYQRRTTVISVTKKRPPHGSN